MLGRMSEAVERERLDVDILFVARAQRRWPA